MNDLKRLPASFWQSATGREPVREWLLELSAADCKAVGDDIRTAEFGWPIGMPLCRKMRSYSDLWEIRTRLDQRRIARVLFSVHDNRMVLLHRFIKKSQATPTHEINTALGRLKGLKL